MAKKKKQSARAITSDAATFDPRILIPIAGAALAVVVPAIALGGRALREQESEVRSRVLPGLPIGGAVLAVGGAAVWQRREHLLRLGGDVASAAKDLAGRVANRMRGIEADDTDDTDDMDGAADTPVSGASSAASPMGQDEFATPHDHGTAASHTSLQRA